MGMVRTYRYRPVITRATLRMRRIDMIKITNERMRAIADMMDDELREAVHSEMSPCSNKAFLLAYRARCPWMEWEAILSEFPELKNLDKLED